MKCSNKLSPNKKDIWVILSVIFVGILFFVGSSLMNSHYDDCKVVITKAGETIYEEKLSHITKDIQLSFSNLEYPMVICVTSNGVWVEESQCKGQDCIRSGKITRAGESIACLPNQVIIFLKGTNASFDVVTG